MTPGTKYFIPVFIAALQLSCGKNVNADKNQACLTVFVALNHVFKSLDCIQDILQRTLDISQGSTDGVEELAVTVKKQFDEQTQTMAEMKLQLEHTFSSSVKHITDEIKNSKTTDDRFKSELERLAAENEELKRNIADKEKQVHNLSGKLIDSQQRIQDLEENLKQLKFEMETLPGAIREEKFKKEFEYALSAGPNNELQCTVKVLMEVNAHGKAEIENKDKQVQNLSIRLEDSQRKVEELQANVEQLTLKVASQEGMRECIQQQKIKEQMEEFKKGKDWPAIGRDLKKIIYNDSEAYTQLQNIDVTLLSPLHQIGILGYTELASLLLAGGLPVDTAIDLGGSSMLHAAAEWNQLPLAKLLILHGADINAQRGTYGRTPLMLAAAYGSIDVVKWLVWAGADVTITARDGRTALDEARLQGQQEVVKFLERINAVSLEDRIQSP